MSTPNISPVPRVACRVLMLLIVGGLVASTPATSAEAEPLHKVKSASYCTKVGGVVGEFVYTDSLGTRYHRCYYIPHSHEYV